MKLMWVSRDGLAAAVLDGVQHPGAGGAEHRRRSMHIGLVCAAMLLIGVGQQPARAGHTSDVTAVAGSAYGYFSNVGLFGGPPATRGPAPAVTLPAGGSAVPITATAPTGSAQYGPAVIFTSGPLTASTQGTTGPTGSVTSSANIQTANTSGQEVFTARNVASSCTASATGVSASTSIAGGTLQTSDGDPNVGGDETVVAIPANPSPNTTYSGSLNSVGDTFRYVFNEQIVNPDGSITVNAAHQYLLGPTAVGELIVGRSVCGVTAKAAAHVAPAAPAVTGSDPGSPANDNTPEVKGTAPAGTTVSVYANASCAGLPAVQGTAAAFASPGFTVSVADNSVTTFYAAASDPSTGLDSPCSSSSHTYVEDSTAPETTITSGPSGATADTTPVLTFVSDEAGTSFACRLDSAPFAPCSSPLQTATLAGGAHTFDVRATDMAGNTDSTPASRSFTVATTTTPPPPPGCSLRGNVLVGTSGNDVLRGTARTDIIVGLSGSDVVRGLGGRDCLFGGSGADRLFGGAGADLLFGGLAGDVLSGEAGNDRLKGDAGRDRMDGGAGSDNLFGGSGSDRLTDRRGTDRFSGGAGSDRIDARDSSPIGRRGRDRISCGTGRDTVLANRRDIVQRDCETVRLSS